MMPSVISADTRRHPETSEHLSSDSVRLGEQPEKQMLGSDVVVAVLVGDPLSMTQYVLGSRRVVHRAILPHAGSRAEWQSSVTTNALPDGSPSSGCDLSDLQLLDSTWLGAPVAGDEAVLTEVATGLPILRRSPLGPHVSGHRRFGCRSTGLGDWYPSRGDVLLTADSKATANRRRAR